MKRLRMWYVELVFNHLLKPYERVITAQKVLAKHGKDPNVQKEFETAFGTNQTDRTRKQWRNLVRQYGMETVCKIENMSEVQVRMKCMKFSDRIDEQFRQKRMN